MTVLVKIENWYSDDYESSVIEEFPDPPDTDLDEWFEEIVWPRTGDGHGADEDLGYAYVATIIAAESTDLIGATCEWVGS